MPPHSPIQHPPTPHVSPDVPCYEVVVIGAGQAGLAVGYYLQQAGVDFRILEAAETIGAAWAGRWESLRLFTPAGYDGLPGVAFPAPRGHYPTKDEVAGYLATYAATFDLPVTTGTPVTGLFQGPDGRFVLEVAGGATLGARAVVVATGAFGHPWTPALAGHLDPALLQLHSHHYRTPAQLPDGVVLVVGGGNSGVQIAQELAGTGRQVHLAARTRPRHLPQRLLGRDLFWWLNGSGVLGAPATSRLGRRLCAADPVIGTPRSRLLRAGVRFHPAVVAAAGRTATFADDASVAPEAVLWATGYRQADPWVKIPAALDATGALRTATGHTPVPGLFTLGRSWQRDRGSALLGFVGTDARRLVAELTA